MGHPDSRGERRRLYRTKKQDRQFIIDVVHRNAYWPFLYYSWQRDEAGEYIMSRDIIKSPTWKRKRRLKRAAGKAYRQYREDGAAYKGNGYRRIFDYWWELY